MKVVKYYKEYKIIEDGIEYKVREYPNGSKAWFLNGELHRLDKPAIEWDGGDKYWYFNGKLHRVNGPAIEWSGSKYWYLDGIEYTKKEYYKELLKRKLITEKEAFIELI